MCEEPLVCGFPFGCLCYTAVLLSPSGSGSTKLCHGVAGFPDTAIDKQYPTPILLLLCDTPDRGVCSLLDRLGKQSHAAGIPKPSIIQISCTWVLRFLCSWFIALACCFHYTLQPSFFLHFSFFFFSSNLGEGIKRNKSKIKISRLRILSLLSICVLLGWLWAKGREGTASAVGLKQ